MARFSRFRIHPFLFAGLLSALWLFSCATSTIRPDFSAPGFSIQELKGSKSLLVVSKQADIRQFAEAFRKSFGSPDSLSRFFSITLADSLNQGTPGFSITTEASDSLRVQYILEIKNIIIDSSMKVTKEVMAPSGPNGNMAMTGGGVSVSCVVSYDLEIMEREGMAKKAAFKVQGISTVFLSETEALRNAVWNGVRLLIGYLREGRTGI